MSINSAGMAEEERARACAELSAECGVPCVDPLITGTGAVLDEIERTFGRSGEA